ncbi:hypothetical protein D3C75_1367390 [compost metagenome]
MHYIRPEDILRKLDNLAGSGWRQKLGTDSRVDDVVEQLVYGLVCLVVGIPGDDILNKRLRNT